MNEHPPISADIIAERATEIFQTHFQFLDVPTSLTDQILMEALAARMNALNTDERLAELHTIAQETRASIQSYMWGCDSKVFWLFAAAHACIFDALQELFTP